MSRDTPVRDVMSTSVVTFGPDENISDAMSRLVDAGFEAGPVVNDEGMVVGVLSSGDLIMQETQLHLPTMISILGATLEWPSSKKKFDEDLEKTLGSTVGEVMSDKLVSIWADNTIEDAATLMHDHDVSCLPVVAADGSLVGVVTRGVILRTMVRDDRAEAARIGADADADADVADSGESAE